MTTPYHVRLAISQYGEQFRAELFTEDLGDTEGDLLNELPSSIAEWVPYLAQGAELPPDAARQLGKDLFTSLLGQPENAKKWSEVLTRAGRNKQSIRLLIDATSEAVRDLPYGLLCEPHDDWFLFRGKKQSVEFVRILRRCSPRPLKLGKRLRVLIAVAEPQSADVPPFDATLRIQKLISAMHQEVDLFLCGPEGSKPIVQIAANPAEATAEILARYTRTTRDSLCKALKGEFDILHLLAHGHGAGVLLCKEDGTPAETTASELGEWCSAGKTSLAFLQVCKAGQTAGRGGFGGVAQQLLNPRGGNLAAVVASTFPLDAEHSTDAAVGFYRELAAGKSPEAAITSDRAETDWCWAFLELWARPGALGGTQQRAAFQFVSPYRGLSSFGEQDADLFFGRKSEIVELMQVLRAEPVVAVVGDSGSGKTSLLQAGLVYAVHRDGLIGTHRWKVVTLRPGYRPAQSLLTAIVGTPTEPTPNALQKALRADTQPLMIVFDQFEEIFTLARDHQETQSLIESLVEAVEQQRDRFRLIIGMRSEFIGQAASMKGLSRLIRRPWVLRPPGVENLRAIVSGPAEHCGYTFQGPLQDGNPAHSIGLLDRILADPLLARDKGGLTAAPLPLLQFALERLWLKAVEKGMTEFTHEVFDEIGGMGKAIAQHAEAVYQSSATATEYGARGRAIAEHVITSLVSTQGTRQPRGRVSFQAETGQPDATREVIDYLVGERLLTVRTDPEDMTNSLVDLSHEALIQNWDRLRGWLSEDPQGRAMREEFRKDAEQWEKGFAGIQPRSRLGLPGSDVAVSYLAWIDASKPKLSPTQQDFTEAMREMLSRHRRRRQLVMGALAILALASTILAIYADSQAGHAKQNESTAKANAKSAEKNAAEALLEKRIADERASTLALEKGIQLCEQAQPRLGILALAYSLQICPQDAPDLRRVILTNLAAWAPQLMCLDEVHALRGGIMATDRAGKYALRILSKGEEEIVNKAQLIDIDTEKAIGPPVATLWMSREGKLDLAYQIARATLLPNGIALLTGLGHSSVWDMKTGKQLGVTIKHGANVSALSPDGKIVAGCDAEGSKVNLYDVATGKLINAGYQHPGQVYSISFSADAKLLGTGCGRRANAQEKDLLHHEGYVHLFDITEEDTSTKRVRAKHGMPQVATCVEISPNQKWFTGGNFELCTWSIPEKGSATGSSLMNTQSSPESTIQIAYDPENPSEYITCNPSGVVQIHTSDNSVRVKGERLTPQGWVAGMGFRADGRVFTANGYDGTVRIWDRPLPLGEKRKPENAGSILSVDFRQDGQAVALGTKKGLVHFYDLRLGTKKVFLCNAPSRSDHRRAVNQVKFSKDGSRLIVYDEILTAFVFDTNAGPEPIRGKHRLIGVANDGQTAVVETAPNVFQISQVGSQKNPTSPKLEFMGRFVDDLSSETDEEMLHISKVAFSPDCSMVAVRDRHHEVHLFQTSTGERICPPLKHRSIEHDDIQAVEFSPTGNTLLTRAPMSLFLWEAKTGKLIHKYVNRTGVQITRFSRSGKLVLGGTNFNMAQIWDEAGNEVSPMPMMHAAQIWGLDANNAETLLITASSDKSARIWDRVTGRPVSAPMLHGQGVSDAVFSPDGKLALTGSWDETARLWAVPEPVPDDEKRIIAWVETLTGLKVQANATGELLTASEWLQRKKQLDELGGPPLKTNP